MGWGVNSRCHNLSPRHSSTSSLLVSRIIAIAGDENETASSIAALLGAPEKDGLLETCRAVQWRRRKCLKFYERCAIRLNGGAGEHRELVRSRDLSDDGGIVFVNEDDDDSGVTGILRLRVFDFSGDDEGQASVAAAPVYCGAIRK